MAPAAKGISVNAATVAVFELDSIFTIKEEHKKWH